MAGGLAVPQVPVAAAEFQPVGVRHSSANTNTSQKSRGCGSCSLLLGDVNGAGVRFLLSGFANLTCRLLSTAPFESEHCVLFDRNLT